MLFKVLDVTNGKSQWFLLLLPLTSNLRALALAVPSVWNALPCALCMAGFFSLLKSPGMTFQQRIFSESFLNGYPSFSSHSSSYCSAVFSL